MANGGEPEGCFSSWAWRAQRAQRAPAGPGGALGAWTSLVVFRHLMLIVWMLCPRGTLQLLGTTSSFPDLQAAHALNHLP